jgi:hypothetical protein
MTADAKARLEWQRNPLDGAQPILWEDLPSKPAPFANIALEATWPVALAHGCETALGWGVRIYLSLGLLIAIAVAIPVVIIAWPFVMVCAKTRKGLQ